jgi:V/A-type H+/Na+-transporting ATPase subunit E
MANDKLQDLIETLKKQGVESGEKAGKDIVESARKQAEDILAKARAEAASIVGQAREESDKQMKRLQSSMEIAASQFVNSLKGVIEENLLTLPLQKELTGDLRDPDFLKTLVTRFVETYAQTAQGEDIQLLLPKGTDQDMMKFAMQLMARHYGQGGAGDELVLELDAHDIRFGFQVNKKQGNVRLDFSDEAFLSLFLGFLVPKFRELFKGIKIGELSKK